MKLFFVCLSIHLYVFDWSVILNGVAQCVKATAWPHSHCLAGGILLSTQIHTLMDPFNILGPFLSLSSARMVSPRIGSSIDAFYYVSVSLQRRRLDSQSSVACQKKRTGLPCFFFILKKKYWTLAFLFL
jgi:hypothetical protein